MFPFDVLTRPYELEGDDEYEILSQVSESDSERDSEEGSDEEDEEDELNRSEQDVDFKDIYKEDILISHRRDSGWGYGIVFDRSPLFELRGNLVLSATVSLPKRGMIVTVDDPITFRQVYRWISWYDLQAVLGKNLDMIEEELSNLDESNVLEMIEDVLSAIEVMESEEEGVVLWLQRDKEIPISGKPSVDEEDVSSEGDEKDDKDSDDESKPPIPGHAVPEPVQSQHFEPLMIARIRERNFPGK